MNKIGIERDLFNDLVRFLEDMYDVPDDMQSRADHLLNRCYKVQDEIREDNAEIDDCVPGQD